MYFFTETTPPQVALGFHGYSLMYSSQDFLELRDALTTRYGEPSATEDKPFETRGGLKDTNKILTWEWDCCSIRMNKYSGSIRDGMTIFETRSGRAESQRRRSAQKGEAGKDL